MRDIYIYIDVTAEVSMAELSRVQDPTREVFELLRTKADAVCAESGARLRTDRAPEMHIRKGQTYLGVDVLLVASRWAVVAPDSVLTAV